MLSLTEVLPLRYADMKAGKIDLFDRRLFPAPESAGLLVKKGLVERDGTLTEEGIQMATALHRKMPSLWEGLPAKKRIRPYPPIMPSRTTGWLYGYFKRTRWVSNGEIILYVAGIPKWAKGIKKADDVVKAAVKKRIEWVLCHMDGFRRSVAYKWQVPREGVDDVLWFQGADAHRYKEAAGLRGCIKTIYADWCWKNFMGCNFYIHQSQREEMPMIVRVGSKKSRYFGNGLLAIIAQVKHDFLTSPKEKEGVDGKKKEKEEVQDE